MNSPDRLTGTPRNVAVCSVLYADIAGYDACPIFEQIALTESAKRLLSEMVAHLPPGDVVLSEQDSAITACFPGDPCGCLDLALALRTRLEGDDEFRHLPLRMGVNLGRVSIDPARADRLMGDGIENARALAAMIRPGEIIASRAFYEVIGQIDGDRLAVLHFRGWQRGEDTRVVETYRIGPGRAVEAVPSWARQDSGGTAPLMVVVPPMDAATASIRSRLPVMASMLLVACALGGVGWLMTRPLNYEAAAPTMTHPAIVGRVAPAYQPPPPERMASVESSARAPETGPAAAGAAGIGGSPGQSGSLALPDLPAASPPEVAAGPSVPPAGPARQDAGNVAGPGAASGTVEGAVVPATPGGGGAPAASAATTGAKASPGAARQKILPKAATHAKAARPTFTAARGAVRPAAQKRGPDGTLVLMIRPWGEVFIDGKSVGVSPPLKQIQLAPGRRVVAVKNADLPGFQQTIDVLPAGQKVFVHRFTN